MTAIAAPTHDTRTLIPEVERYLAAVDVFRREGYEPRWSSAHPPAAGRGDAGSSVEPKK